MCVCNIYVWIYIFVYNTQTPTHLYIYFKHTDVLRLFSNLCTRQSKKCELVRFFYLKNEFQYRIIFKLINKEFVKRIMSEFIIQIDH